MDERERAAEHLKVLSVLYYVSAALWMLGSCVGCFYGIVGGIVGGLVRHDAQPEAPEQPSPVPPEWFGRIFVVFGIVIVGVTLTAAALNFISGRSIARRRNHTFSLVVAGLNCVHFPLGTALGAWSFILLLKPEVRELYDRSDGTPPPAA